MNSLILFLNSFSYLNSNDWCQWPQWFSNEIFAVKTSEIFNLFVWLSLPIKQQEHLHREEKYSSLQEEAQRKTEKIKKVWTVLRAAKSEVRKIIMGDT